MRTSNVVALASAAMSAAMGPACVKFDALPFLDAAPASDAALDAPVDAARYRAVAVRFDSTQGDYIWDSSLANTTNSPRGTFSMWLHLNAGDNQQQYLSVAQVVGIGGVFRGDDNHIHFVMPNCAGVTLLDMTTKNVYTASSGWLHVLASWDVSANRANIYINDVPDIEDNPKTSDGDICYASLRWGIGGLQSGKLDADVADVYAALGTFVDVSEPVNRARFGTPDGKPVDLGLNCNSPTGMTPTGCFNGAVTSWFSNKGLGLGFKVEGDGLALAPTSPSD